MTPQISGVDISIDGAPPVKGTLSTGVDQIDVTTMTESRPDPEWSMVDALGHFHAWDADGKLPTLKAVSVHQPCAGGCGHDDDGCDGYDTTEHRCLICDQTVAPQSIVTSNLYRRTIPGRKWWQAEVRAVVSVGCLVSVVARTSTGTYFGMAQSVGITATSDDGPRTWLAGWSALGKTSRLPDAAGRAGRSAVANG